MMRWACMGLLMAACSKKSTGPETPPEPAPMEKPAPSTSPAKQASAPVQIDVTVGETESSLTLTFGAKGTDVVVEAWGATGLTVSTPKQAWSGAVDKDQVEKLTITHSGAGDLAVSVSGTFGGKTTKKVKSFTVGSPERPPVGEQTMVDGVPVKGGTARPR